MQEKYVARLNEFWTSQKRKHNGRCTGDWIDWYAETVTVSKTAAKSKAAGGEVFDYLSKEKTNGGCQDMRKLRGQPNGSSLSGQHHCAVHLREPFDPTPVSMC